MDTPSPERRALTETEGDEPEGADDETDAEDGPPAIPDRKAAIQTLQGGWVQATGRDERRAIFNRLFTLVTPWTAPLARRYLSPARQDAPDTGRDGTPEASGPRRTVPNKTPKTSREGYSHDYPGLHR